MKDQTILYVIGVIILVVLLAINMFNNNGLGSYDYYNPDNGENDTYRDYSKINNYIDQYINESVESETENKESNNSNEVSGLISSIKNEYINEESENDQREGDYSNYNELNFMDFINGKTNETKQEEPINNINENSVEEIFDESDYSGFYYNYLTKKQKEIYGKIVEGCQNFETVIKLNNESMNDVSIAETAVSYDHPEFYWTTGYIIVTLNDKVKEVQCQVPFDAKEKMEQVDKIVSNIISKSGNSSVDKVKYFYDWIVENTEYDITENSQDMTSVFLDGKSVCAGYSKAFQYLCQKSNITCAYVSGTTKENTLHAWNLVKLNGKYYWVDVTWGDPVFAEIQESKVNYNYYLVSDKDLLGNHKIDQNITLQDGRTIPFNINYPSCTDDSLNYYVQKGCYFYTYDKNPA